MITMLSFGSCKDEAIVNSVKIKKLDFYTETFAIQDQGFEPQTKVKYEYDDSDRLIKYRVFSHNPDTQILEELRYFNFTYSNNRVSQIAGFLQDSSAASFVEYLYEYFDNGLVSRITEVNHNADVTTKADFTYDFSNHDTRVTYSSSNGSSFVYKFHNENENALNDKTTRGSELCNTGTYMYDDHINPFKTLGYLDFTLNNISANNKISEDVNYAGCSFPSLVPKSYSYQYDADGYPTLMTTYYSTPNIVRLRLYFYK